MPLRAGLLLSSGRRLSLLQRPSSSVLAAGRRTNRALLSSTGQTAGDGTKFQMPFKSLMAANRGEIAVRIMRAGNELGLRTVGIFSKEDRFTQHRCVYVVEQKVAQQQHQLTQYQQYQERFDPHLFVRMRERREKLCYLRISVCFLVSCGRKEEGTNVRTLELTKSSIVR